MPCNAQVGEAGEDSAKDKCTLQPRTRVFSPAVFDALLQSLQRTSNALKPARGHVQHRCGTHVPFCRMVDPPRAAVKFWNLLRKPNGESVQAPGVPLKEFCF